MITKETFLHTLWRLLVAITALAFLAGGVMIVLHALEVVGPVKGRGAGFTFNFDLGEETFRTTLGWIGGSLLAMLAGLLLLLLAVARAAESGKQIVLNSQVDKGLYGGGQVTVSVQSLRALVAYTAEKVEGIRETVPRIRLRRDGWHIDCRVVLQPDLPLPDVTARIKKALLEAVEYHTGLPVARVNIAAQLKAIDADKRIR